MVNKVEFGNYLKQLRENMKLSTRQVQLACGVNSSYVSQIERGLKMPSPSILEKLALVYNVSYENLMIAAGYLSDNKANPGNQTEMNSFLQEKTLGDALVRISQLVIELNLPQETLYYLWDKAIKKYGIPNGAGGKAAHGPNIPGTGALKEDDMK
ncbi:helix-turn-helix domain-containing protein [Desulfolucanica intricata]|uniref:helix-turn-helix domain-containing protein n=1 Tax=Desulfolucanica intricata TaxID=1285191 RepID=UPI00082CFD28|nr:helix-turn-helix transcriptional regulator [Desulfolucanica intricata]